MQWPIGLIRQRGRWLFGGDAMKAVVLAGLALVCVGACSEAHADFVPCGAEPDVKGNPKYAGMKVVPLSKIKRLPPGMTRTNEGLKHAPERYTLTPQDDGAVRLESTAHPGAVMYETCLCERGRAGGSGTCETLVELGTTTLKCNKGSCSGTCRTGVIGDKKSFEDMGFELVF